MLTEAQRTQLKEGAAQFGLILDEPTLDRFARFAALLEEGNRQFNLTRIAPQDVVPLHFLDSLALAAAVTPRAGSRLLDVGTGAGFPGIPLALAYPNLDVTLLDSTRKRLLWLDGVIAALQLPHVRTLHGRAEEIARLPAHRERYDIVTARAVAKMPPLAGWLLPLVRPGGIAVAYKSREIEGEVEAARAAIHAHAGTVDRRVKVTLPGREIERTLVILRKNTLTGKQSARKIERHDS